MCHSVLHLGSTLQSLREFEKKNKGQVPKPGVDQKVCSRAWGHRFPGEFNVLPGVQPHRE